MKKLSLLLAIFVFMSTTQLSLAADPTAQRDTAETVDYKSTQTITYKQSDSIEIDKIRNNKEVVLVMDTSSEMNSLPPHEENPFDSALFSGSDTKYVSAKLTNLDIDGNVHSNSGIQMEAKSTDINGTLAAVLKDSISIPKSSISTPIVKTGVAPIEMEDLSDRFKAASEESATRFSTDMDLQLATPIQWYKKMLGKSWDGEFLHVEQFSSKNLYCQHGIIDGRMTWTVSGDDLILKEDRPLFFDGDLVLANGSITGNGFIVATGNISISVGSYKNSDGTEANVGIYSVNGDVTVSTSNFDLKGLIYAPGHKDPETEIVTGGNIKFTTGIAKVVGSVVGNSVTVAGNDLTLDYEVTDVHEDIMESYNISKHITIAKERANSFINKLAGYNASDIKMSVITYGDKAEFIGYGFYNIKDNKERQLLIDGVNNITIDVNAESPVGSNLGDGLRKAYYMLKNSDLTADKYIVALSGSEPNKWTEGPALGTFMQGYGDVWNPSKLISSFDEDGKTYKDQKAFDYAWTIGGMIKKDSASSIKSFFLDIKAGEKIKGFTGDTGTMVTPGGIVVTPGAIAVAAGANAYNPEGDETTAFTFETMFQKNLVVDIADEILNDASYEVPKVTVMFTDIIPEYVDVKEYPNSLEYSEAVKALTFSGDAIITSETTDHIYVKLQDDITIKVKYNAKGTITYGLVPIPITFTFTTDPVTADKASKTVYINTTYVDVGWLIDIN